MNRGIRIESPVGFSWCGSCQSHKSETEFHRGERFNGLSSRCKSCAYKRNEKYIKNNHEKWCVTRRNNYRRKSKIVLERRRLDRISSPEINKWQTIKGRCASRGIPLVMTKQEFISWYIRQEQRCFYCDSPSFSLGILDNREYFSFPIDRKNSNLPYSIENMCLCCMECNMVKNNIFNEIEMREIAQKYIKPKWLHKFSKVIA